MIQTGDFRWSALHRYHDAAIEGAIILTAFSRLQIAGHVDGPYLTGPRLGVQIMTAMHNFSLNARKAIEIADSKKPGLLAKVKAEKFEPKQVMLANGSAYKTASQSLYWIISRIIHSQNTGVGFIQTSQEFSGRGRIQTTEKSKYFLFRSDFDKIGPDHCVDIDELMASYLNSWINNEINEAMKIT
jgi:hypothetical protein